MSQQSPVSITFCGDAYTGKSNLIQQLVGIPPPPQYDPTIEDQYTAVRTVDGRPYHITLNDTAGDDAYRASWSESILRSDAFVLVYDVTRPFARERLRYFINLVEAETNRRYNAGRGKPPVLIIVGNKCDLESLRQVKKQQGAEWARRYGRDFLETSARKMFNLEALLTLAIRRVYELRNMKSIGSPVSEQKALPAPPLDQPMSRESQRAIVSREPQRTIERESGDRRRTERSRKQEASKRSEHSKGTKQSETSDSAKLSEGSRRPLQLKRLEEAEVIHDLLASEGLKRPRKVKKPEEVKQPQRPVKTEEPKRPLPPVNTGESRRPERPVKTEESKRPQQPVKAEEPKRPQPKTKSEESEPPKKANRSDKPRRTKEPERPRQPVKRFSSQDTAVSEEESQSKSHHADHESHGWFTRTFCCSCQKVASTHTKSIDSDSESKSGPGSESSSQSDLKQSSESTSDTQSVEEGGWCMRTFCCSCAKVQSTKIKKVEDDASSDSGSSSASSSAGPKKTDKSGDNDDKSSATSSISSSDEEYETNCFVRNFVCSCKKIPSTRTKSSGHDGDTDDGEEGNWCIRTFACSCKKVPPVKQKSDPKQESGSSSQTDHHDEKAQLSRTMLEKGATVDIKKLSSADRKRLETYDPEDWFIHSFCGPGLDTRRSEYRDAKQDIRGMIKQIPAMSQDPKTTIKNLNDPKLRSTYNWVLSSDQQRPRLTPSRTISTRSGRRQQREIHRQRQWQRESNLKMKQQQQELASKSKQRQGIPPSRPRAPQVVVNQQKTAIQERRQRQRQKQDPAVTTHAPLKITPPRRSKSAVQMRKVKRQLPPVHESPVSSVSPMVSNVSQVPSSVSRVSLPEQNPEEKTNQKSRQKSERELEPKSEQKPANEFYQRINIPPTQRLSLLEQQQLHQQQLQQSRMERRKSLNNRPVMRNPSQRSNRRSTHAQVARYLAEQQRYSHIYPVEN